MLLFSTILDINPTLTKDAFIKLVIRWNQESTYENNIIPDLEWHGEMNIRYGTDRLWLDIEEYRNKNIVAVRFEKTDEKGAVWDTDYVMNFKERKMAIRLERSFLEDAIAIDSQFSTPHFITLLIEKGYVKADRDLPVLRTPIMVGEDKLPLLSDIMNENTHYRLPVVYVSKTMENENPVDAGILAGRLKGVAHVLVQEDMETNAALREMCVANNDYLGAIGIYFPGTAVGYRRYPYRGVKGIDRFIMEKVIRAVIQYSNSQLLDTLYTWQGVNNALLRDSLASQREERKKAEQAKKAAEVETAKLKDSLNEEEKRIKEQALEDAKAEADKILEGFDDDLERLQKQVEELTRANEILQYENQGLKAKLNASDAQPVLFMGDEVDFYQGEIKDLLLSALTDALSNMPEKSRRADVIRDIIENNDYQKKSEKRESEVKRLLRDYSGITGKLRQELEELGFVIMEDGKHYKITYYGDERYQAVFGKTPSDVRSGKNNAATVAKMFY